MRSSSVSIPRRVPSLVTRSFQQISEQLASSPEITDFPGHTVQIFEELDTLHSWCSKITLQMQSLIEPNPAYRFTSNFKKFVTRGKNEDEPATKPAETELGLILDRAVSIMAPSGPTFGLDLSNMANLQQELGKSKEKLKQVVKEEIITGLNAITQQLSELIKERKELENKRLDVDFYKGRLRSSSTASAIESATTSLNEATYALNIGVATFENECKEKIPVFQSDLSQLALKFTKLQHSHLAESLSVLTSATAEGDEQNNSFEKVDSVSTVESAQTSTARNAVPNTFII